MPTKRRLPSANAKQAKKTKGVAASATEQVPQASQEPGVPRETLESLLDRHELGVAWVELDALHLGEGRTRPVTQTRLRQARDFLTKSQGWQRTSPAVATLLGTAEEEAKVKKLLQTDTPMPEIDILASAPSGLSVNEGFHRLHVMRELVAESAWQGSKRVYCRILKRETPLDIQRRIGDFMNLDHQHGESNTFVDLCWRMNEVTKQHVDKPNDKAMAASIEFDANITKFSSSIMRFVRLIGDSNIRTMVELQNNDHGLIWDLHYQENKEAQDEKETPLFEGKCFLMAPTPGQRQIENTTPINRKGLNATTLPFVKEALVHCWSVWVLSGGTKGMKTEDWANWCSRVDGSGVLSEECVPNATVRTQFLNHISDSAVVDSITSQLAAAELDATARTSLTTELALMRAYAGSADALHRDMLQRRIDALALKFPDAEFAKEGTAISDKISAKTFRDMDANQKRAVEAMEKLRACQDAAATAGKVWESKAAPSKRKTIPTMNPNSMQLALIAAAADLGINNAADGSNLWFREFLKARLVYKRYEQTNSILQEDVKELSQQQDKYTAERDQLAKVAKYPTTTFNMETVGEFMTAAFRRGDHDTAEKAEALAYTMVKLSLAQTKHGRSIVDSYELQKCIEKARRQYLLQLVLLDKFGYRVPGFPQDDPWRPAEPEDLHAEIKALFEDIVHYWKKTEPDFPQLSDALGIPDYKLVELYQERTFTHDRREWDYTYAKEYIPAAFRAAILAWSASGIRPPYPFVRFPVNACEVCEHPWDTDARAYMHTSKDGKCVRVHHLEKIGSDCDAVDIGGKTGCTFCGKLVDDDGACAADDMHRHNHFVERTMENSGAAFGWCHYRLQENKDKALLVLEQRAVSFEESDGPIPKPNPVPRDESDPPNPEASNPNPVPRDEQSDAPPAAQQSKRTSARQARAASKKVMTLTLTQEGDVKEDSEDEDPEETDCEEDAQEVLVQEENGEKSASKKARAKKASPAKKSAARKKKTALVEPPPNPGPIAWTRKDKVPDYNASWPDAWTSSGFNRDSQKNAYNAHSETVLQNYFVSTHTTPKSAGVIQYIKQDKIREDALSMGLEWIENPQFVVIHALYLTSSVLGDLWKAVHAAVPLPVGEDEWHGRIILYDMTWAQLKMVTAWLCDTKRQDQAPEQCFVVSGKGKSDRRYILTVNADGMGNFQFKPAHNPWRRGGLSYVDGATCVAGKFNSYKLVGLAEFFRQRVFPGQTVWCLNEPYTLGAATAVLGLGCRAYIVNSVTRQSAADPALVKFAATMGHPDVGTMVYKAYADNVLGRLVTTMTLVEHAVARPRFDPLCAVLGRTAPTETIKQGASSIYECLGNETDGPYQHPDTVLDKLPRIDCSLKEDRSDDEQFTHYQGSKVKAGTVLAIFPSWVFAADFAPVNEANLVTALIQEKGTQLHESLLLLPPARLQSFDALRVLLPDRPDGEATCALHFDSATWHLKLTAAKDFGFDAEEFDPEDTGIRKVYDLWADEDENNEAWVVWADAHITPFEWTVQTDLLQYHSFGYDDSSDASSDGH